MTARRATTSEERERFGLIVAEVDRHNREDFSETLWDHLDDVVMIAGYPLLGPGGSRLVFALDDTRVLKIGYDTWAGEEQQNLTEIEVWKEAGESKRRLLAPVLDHGMRGRWLVMARTTPVSRVPRARMSMLLKVTGDVGKNNVGMLDGNIGLHDYGLESDEGWG